MSTLRSRLAELERTHGVAVAKNAVPLATAALRAAGFTVYPWDNGAGLAVDEAPGLDAKLDELEGKGIRPGVVFVLRRLEDEPQEAGGSMEAAGGWGPVRQGGNTGRTHPRCRTGNPSQERR